MVILKKEKIKFEDHKLALQYFEKDRFCIKFDLKSGYHHIDICKECQTFLGFEWKGECFLLYSASIWFVYSPVYIY